MCYAYGYPEEIELIEFNKKGERGVSGRADDGIIVFVDRNSNITVQCGETWHCRLRRGSGSSKYYLAWPVDKIKNNLPELQKEKKIPANFNLFFALGNDRLFSNELKNGNYFVYRSLNGLKLQITPSDNGNIRCKENLIVIEGLDDYMTGDFPHVFGYEFINGSFLIELDKCVV